MGRRKSKLSTFSIFHWFYSNAAIVLGLVPQARRNRRTLTKRCNRKITHTRQKYVQKDINSRTYRPELSILNNNNNRSFDNLKYSDSLSDVDQQRISCILIENKNIAELSKYPSSIFKDSQIIDLQELIQLIQSKAMNRTHEDVSTMTTTNQTSSCTNFNSQSENARRLKALEFIRMFIEKTKEDFCQYLLNEEHLCEQKTSAIYQMIKQFLKAIYQSEHIQKLKSE